MLRVMAVDKGLGLFGGIGLGHFCAKWTMDLRERGKRRCLKKLCGYVRRWRWFITRVSRSSSDGNDRRTL